MEFPSPEVTPWDRSNIKVSWKKVFENCLKKDVRALKVKAETKVNGATSTSEKPVNLEDNEVLIDGSPCIRHTANLVLSSTDGKEIESNKTEYNKASFH